MSALLLMLPCLVRNTSLVPGVLSISLAYAYTTDAARAAYAYVAAVQASVVVDPLRWLY